jgi:hypothetical protein
MLYTSAAYIHTSMLDIAALPKISADAHVDEPHDLWSSRLPADLREDAPHQIRAEDDGGWRLVVNGELDESGGQSRGPGLGAGTYGSAAEENALREENASIELPSHHLRRQVHATSQRDPVAIASRSLTGVECLMWGDRLPAPRGHSPDSREVLAETLAGVAGVDATDIAAITAGNVARVFGFAPGILDATP